MKLPFRRKAPKRSGRIAIVSVGNATTKVENCDFGPDFDQIAVAQDNAKVSIRNSRVRKR